MTEPTAAAATAARRVRVAFWLGVVVVGGTIVMGYVRKTTLVTADVPYVAGSILLGALSTIGGGIAITTVRRACGPSVVAILLNVVGFAHSAVVGYCMISGC